MTLFIHRIDDSQADEELTNLRSDHEDVKKTFMRSERVMERLLAHVSKHGHATTQDMSAWIILRGGLVAWRPLLKLDWSVIGFLGPVRDGNTSNVVYSSAPPSSKPENPVVIDWILATGSTIEASIRRLCEISHEPLARVSVAVAMSCQEGEDRLDNLEGIDVNLYCFRSGLRAKGLLLGYDIGDYAVGYRSAPN